MSYDSLLNDGETLSRVARYEIGRKEGRIVIDLHEVLSGRSDARYIVMPFLTFVHCARYEFYGHGATEDEALQMITINPAWIMGIDSRTGSLDVGKDADIVIWNGPPLSSFALADKVLIDGDVYFDRSLPGFGLVQFKGVPGVGAATGGFPGQSEEVH